MFLSSRLYFDWENDPSSWKRNECVFNREIHKHKPMYALQFICYIHFHLHKTHEKQKHEDLNLSDQQTHFNFTSPASFFRVSFYILGATLRGKLSTDLIFIGWILCWEFGKEPFSPRFCWCSESGGFFPTLVWILPVSGPLCCVQLDGPLNSAVPSAPEACPLSAAYLLSLHSLRNIAGTQKSVEAQSRIARGSETAKKTKSLTLSWQQMQTLDALLVLYFEHLVSVLTCLIFLHLVELASRKSFRKLLKTECLHFVVF